MCISGNQMKRKTNFEEVNLLDNAELNTLHIKGMVSIIIPCLNEEDSIYECVTRALTSNKHFDFKVEVIVVDNNSDDLTRTRAIDAGAKVLACSNIGYGAAIKYGIDHSHGEYIVIGDGDGSYDFNAINDFITPLRNGFDLVSGNRFNESSPRKGAMPWSHRYIGNPVLSKLLNTLYRTDILDAHCGMRSMTREAYKKIKPEGQGFEFCSETLILSILENISIKQIPITLHPTPNGRESKLRSIRDGFRHLYVMFCFLLGVRKARRMMRLAGML